MAAIFDIACVFAITRGYTTCTIEFELDGYFEMRYIFIAMGYGLVLPNRAW